MAGMRKVEPGECVLSIAESEGMPWTRIWEAPENAALAELRGKPNILLPGDEVYVPDLEPREESGVTEQKHKFRAKRGVELRIRIHTLKGPRKNEPFHLEVDGKKIKGTTEKTSAEGLAVIRVPASLRRAVLVVGKMEDEYELFIGFMDPADTVTGQHARLQNMGYDVGGVQTEWDAASVSAIRQFILEHDAQDTAGDATDPSDEKNRTLLKDEYSI